MTPGPAVRCAGRPCSARGCSARTGWCRCGSASRSTRSGRPAGCSGRPRSSSPSVIPVATKNVLSPVTRSSVCSTRSRSCPASRALRRSGVVLGPQPGLDHAVHRLHRAGGDDPLRACRRRRAAGRCRCRRWPRRCAAATSPSENSLIRAPAARTSAISCSCRGRFSTLTVTSAGVAAQRPGHRPHVVLDRGVDVHLAGHRARADQLVHVEDRARVVHAAAVGRGQHGDRVRHPVGQQRGAVHRVDGDVVLGSGAVAHLLAVVEHRGLVLLALPDHHHAAHRHARDHLAHGVDGGPVAALLVAAAGPPAGGQRGGLGDPHQVQPQVAVRELVADAARSLRSVGLGGLRG